MIDHKNKIIFIHMEKTGGTSIEHIFTQKEHWGIKNKQLVELNYDNGCIKHVSYDVAKVIYKDYFDEYKKITIVRHPYSLFISKLNWFFFSGEIKKEDIMKIINNNNDRWKIKELDEFLGSPDNYDYIIRFENFKEDYEKMLERFNLDKDTFKLLHLNKKSDTKEYKSIILLDEAKDIIKNYTNKYNQLYNYNDIL